MNAKLQLAVIGAGIVGASCALALRRRGHEVALLDPEPPGSLTSAGNMALIATSHITPFALPGFWKQVPAMLADPLGPLAIRWRHVPALMPWLWRLLRASRPAEVVRISAALAAAAAQAEPEWRALLGAHSADALIRREGLLFVYRNAAAMAQAAPEQDLRARAGARVSRIGPEELRQMEPALAPDLAGGYFFPDVAHVADPRRVTEAVIAAYLAEGGTLERQTVRAIEIDSEDRPRLRLESGARVFDRAVLAAGIWSPTLLRPFGIRIPLESERGYHLMLPDPGVRLRRPVGAGDHRFMMTPLDSGLRLGGTAEFAGIDAPPNWARADRFLEPARRYLPGLRGAGATRWMGHRPSTPDSLAVIGAAPGLKHVICAFGHGHLGLTQGAWTARHVAEIVDGATAPAAFDPARFG